MKHLTLLLLAAAALMASPSDALAATELIWKSPADGVRIKSATETVLTSSIDISAFDRIRVVAVARASRTPAVDTPVRVELHLTAGTIAFKLPISTLDVDPANTTRTSSGPPAAATEVLDRPVATTVSILATGFTDTRRRNDTVVDVFIYGEKTNPN
jgi:hypothetical protein